MNQFRIHKLFRSRGTNETSERMIDILPKTLTLRNEPYCPALFQEVEIIEPEYNEEEQKLIGLEPATSKYSEKRSLEWITSKLKAHLKENLNKDKKQIVYYSCGTHSRIIACLIKQLQEEMEINPLFVHIGENDTFEHEMEHLGFISYVVIKPEEYIARAYSKFDSANWLNGSASYYRDINYFLLDYLQSKQVIKEPQIISGYGYHSFSGANAKIGNKLQQLNQFDVTNSLFKSEAILPFLSYQALDSVVKTRHRYGKELTYNILSLLDKKLAKFESSHQNKIILPIYIRNYLMSQYENSWWSKNVQARIFIPDNMILTSNSTFHLTSAMFCQRLIKSGYLILKIEE